MRQSKVFVLLGLEDYPVQPNPYSHITLTPTLPLSTGGYEFADGPTVNAAADGAALFAYLKDEKHWPEEKIKKLGEFIIQQCGSSAAEKGQSILSEVWEYAIDFFARKLKTSPTTFLESGKASQSFSETLNCGSGIASFCGNLSKEQALCISLSLLGDQRTYMIESDTRGLFDFSYAVINKICQAKGRYFSIKEFLDHLTPKDSQT